MPSIGYTDSSDSPMGMNISPVLRKDLMILDNDNDGWGSAKQEVNSYEEDVDSIVISPFLAQFLQAKDLNSLSGVHATFHFEVHAELFGRDIVLQIDNITDAIIKTLKMCPLPDALRHACLKAVAAIANYGFDLSIEEDKKRKIVHSLYKPLSNSLLGTQEGLTAGSAMCLEFLVESEFWRFASNEIVNDVCLKVAVALEEKPTQTNAHMGLAMALGKHNILIIEPYARSLIRSGLRVLNTGIEQDDPEKQLDASVVPALPVYSPIDSDFSAEPAASTAQVSYNSDYGGRYLNRRYWEKDMTGVNASLKNGLCSYRGFGSNGSEVGSLRSQDDVIYDAEGEDTVFSGFMHATPKHGLHSNTTPSFERAHSRLDVDDNEFFTTPSNLFHFHQDPTSDCSKKPVRRINRSSSNQLERSGKHFGNSNFEICGEESFGSWEWTSSSESVSSMDSSAPNVNDKVSGVVEFGHKDGVGSHSFEQNTFMKVVLKFVCWFFIILVAVLLSITWMDTQEVGHHFIPT
ncbi:hypothetical protein IFM89_003189 [Coptis chinensis]|uniref:Uncharacterized protein n=1 Tax=Coptis chinensis TaxID=261450 RepID=A0A835H609_9MAGN|nr:hypothetical protein IFM89_003189 [Coptis chinensis]